jgi:hypothetical protein
MNEKLTKVEGDNAILELASALRDIVAQTDAYNHPEADNVDAPESSYARNVLDRYEELVAHLQNTIEDLGHYNFSFVLDDEECELLNNTFMEQRNNRHGRALRHMVERSPSPERQADIEHLEAQLAALKRLQNKIRFGCTKLMEGLHE